MSKKKDPKQALIDKQARTIGELRAKLGECVEAIDEASARVVVLLERVTKYGTHQPGCLWRDGNNPAECDCGWEQAVTGSRG